VKSKDQLGKTKLALLVARDLEFGLAKMWQVFVDEKWDVISRVFRSRDEAITWLKRSNLDINTDTL